MRILQLGLAPCGPFQQQQFDFGSQQAGLHVVYGPNEAGKSSTLRAVSALLYGFKDDELRFGAEDPRVHGVLADPAGGQLAFSRRRGRKDTLLGADRQPLPADSLERFLRSVSQKMFREFFGIDWRALQDGSLHLLQDRGDLAESLFGASLGGAELRRLLKDLEDRAKEKFTPNTRTKGIPKLLSDCKQLEGELKSNITKPEQFARLQQELAKASRDGDKLRVAEQQSRSRLALLGRQRDSLTLWQELCQLRAQREALGHVPTLSKDFAERRVQAQTARAKAHSELRELQAQRQTLGTELERLELRPAWLEHAPAITRLHERRPAIETLRRELPLRSAEASRLDGERRLLRQQLGLAAEASCASPLQRDRLQHLADGLKRDREAHATLLQAVEERRGRLHDTRCKLEALAPSPDPQPLQLLLEHSGRCVEREEQWQRAQAKAQKLAREVHDSLQRLPLWAGTLEELVCFRCPLPAEVDGLEEQMRQKAASRQETQRDAERLRQRQSELQREYDRADVDLPALSELPDIRRRRRQLWEEHCAAPADAELRAQLHTCMEACDDVADRLLAGAERHARRQALARELDQIATGLAELAAREEQLGAERAQLEQQWSALWSPLPAREPQIMSQWRAACERLLQQHAAWSAAEGDNQELGRWVLAAREGLIRSFLELGNGAPAENTTLAELHLRIRAQVQSMEAPRARRRQLEGELSTLESDLVRDENRCTQLQRSLQQGHAELGRVLTELRLDGGIQPAEVPALLQMLSRLEACERECQKLRLAVESETQQVQAFETDVRFLATQLLPGETQQPAEVTVRVLWTELESERRRGRERLERERQLQQIGLAEARQEQLRTKAEQEILRLLSEAESVLEEHLPTLEDYAQRASALDLLITEKRLGLQRLHPGREAATIELELETLEASWLEAQQAQESDKLAGISERLREVDQRSGALQNELQQLSERHGSMDKAQELENLHNRILDESQQFLRLQLALGVLRKEVERYSQSRQQPLLQGTSRYFERLTRGRYGQVLADYLPGLDKQVLFGVRGGDQVSVEHMSQGARDQLCLALRLATLDHWMERRGPFPLVLDDLCVQFDDERAAATLEVLAEVGQRTQVLFFTHLQRDVRLSQPLADSGLACIHQLPAPEGSV